MKTIGVFDSGVGGLSVLRALLREMPSARFVYLADSAYTPYGERTTEEIRDRSHRLGELLRHDYAADALVVACNTATAMAIESLRQRYPDWPIVGVEPALKPAASLSSTGHIGVLATRGTLRSERFAALKNRIESESRHPPHLVCQACDGLADAIERGDDATIQLLCVRYLAALKEQAVHPAPMDTLVLGCTHYPFAAPVLQELCGASVRLVETGEPVARRTRNVLHMPSAEHATKRQPDVTLLSTGDPTPLASAASRWLGLNSPVGHTARR